MRLVLSVGEDKAAFSPGRQLTVGVEAVRVCKGREIRLERDAERDPPGWRSAWTILRSTAALSSISRRNCMMIAKGTQHATAQQMPKNAMAMVAYTGLMVRHE